MSFLLGYDIGSSSVKATLMQADTGQVMGSAFSPEQEMEIIAPQSGWAQQHAQTWWQHVVTVTNKLKVQIEFNPEDIKAIGISYQMHGLVTVDRNGEPLRPAIIWCDSRAVDIGRRAAEDLGRDNCLKNLLNLPGNFTASKLKWVKDNEPDIYSKIYKVMLPGDYIAFKMTDQIRTTQSGLSEGILWDFQKQALSDMVLDYYGLDAEFIPELVPVFSHQGQLTKNAAKQLGLTADIPVTYRGGDQPNNALSLNVLNPGEIAATAGTSGVVYGVSNRADYDPKSRVNTFVHVNHTSDTPRYGVLLCINGTGILNSWLRHNLTDQMDYAQMNELAAEVPVGSEGLVILPYGNGAERTLENKDIGSIIHGLNFNIHNRSHILRAAQEGIVFALNYGLEIMKQISVHTHTVRAGYANMFLSPLFSQAFANLSGSAVELYNTDGSQGAARGAGIGSGIYTDFEQAFVGLDCKKRIEPVQADTAAYEDAYQNWLGVLNANI